MTSTDSSLANLFLTKLNPLFTLGYRRSLEMTDIEPVREEERVRAVNIIFDGFWKEELRRSDGKRSLFRALRRTVGAPKPLASVGLTFVSMGSSLGPPLLLRVLSDHFTALYCKHTLHTTCGSILPDSTLCLAIASLLVLPVISVVCLAHSSLLFGHIGCIVHSSIIPTLYRKSLSLSNQARQQAGCGKVVNLFSADLKTIQLLFENLAEPMLAPIQVAITFGLIYWQVGVSLYPAVGLLFVVFPLNILTFIVFGKHRGQKSVHGDDRIKLTNEILNGIRILKYYAWEAPFCEKIEIVRNRELRSLTYMNYLIVVMVALIFVIPAMMPVVIFTTYVALGNQLTITTAFTTLALINILTNPLQLIPTLIQRSISAGHSIGRIQGFLESEELELYINAGEPSETSSDPTEEKSIAIEFWHASLGWCGSEGEWPDAGPPIASHSIDPLIDEPSTGPSTTPSLPTPIEENVEKALVAPASPTHLLSKFGRSDSDMDYSSAALDEDHVELTELAKRSCEATSEQSEISGGALNRSLHTLTDISLKIPRGQLVAIIGAVGSGKSSLLAALLGEMVLHKSSTANVKISGKIRVRGSIAYHAQTPWILNGTVKDNIMLGLPYDESRFQKAVSAACLEADLAMLPAGVNTEIGEKGINLSGGQKARVSFARTVYRDADIVLLDDPLSAVDAHVGEHLFHSGICQTLRGKTVVLVTHQVHLLDLCNSVIVLEDGQIRAQGTMLELREKGIDISASVVETEPGSISRQAVSRTRMSGAGSRESSSEQAASTGMRKYSLSSNRDSEELLSNEPMSIKQTDTSIATALIVKEEQKSGIVPGHIYTWYIHAGGDIKMIFAFVVSVGASVVQCLAAFWLAQWSQMNEKSTVVGSPLSTSKQTRYSSTFAWLSVLFFVGMSVRSLITASHGLSASRFLHSALLQRVLHAPVSFFDTTPMGRILNRFSVDVVQVDESLPYMLGFIIGMTTDILGFIGNICYTSRGTFLLLIVPIVLLYLQVHVYFRNTNVSLKRLESISRSPLFSEFSHAIAGGSSLRAFGEVERFVSSMESKVDENTSVWLLQQVAIWWLNIRVYAMGGLISFFCALVAVVTSDKFVPANYVGLSLHSAFMAVGTMNSLVTFLTMAEASTNAVERVEFYVENLEVDEVATSQEYQPIPPPEVMDGKQLRLWHEKCTAQQRRIQSKKAEPPADWPIRGEIEGSELCMRYRDGPLVLNKLSFSVKEKEKIGIAGRTGCGKSSLMVALFRIEKLSEGSIVIDGINIDSVPLHTLRSRLGIIPQDPVMFSASVRFNLDPFGKYTDAEIWQVLESVKMRDTIAGLPLKLDELVCEGGENFSAGQRQLICIARALLRQPKILVLDEATASVDNETDELIQKVIRSKFEESTVLTIAHRLHTIIDSDRIMVLDSGALAEINYPNHLIAQGPDRSVFASLWQQHKQSHAKT